MNKIALAQLWQLSRRLLWGIIALAIVLIGNWVVAIRSIQNVVSRDQWVAHTYQVLGSLDDIDSLLDRADNGQRRFVFLAHATDLAAYQQAAPQIPTAFQTAISLTRDNPSQHQRLQHLSALAQTQLAQFQQAVHLAQTGQRAQAVAYEQSNAKTQVGDEIAQQLQQAHATEHQLLTQRIASSSGSVALAVTTTVISSISLFLLLTFTMIALGYILMRQRHYVSERERFRQDRQASQMLAQQHTSEIMRRQQELEVVFEAMTDGLIIYDAAGHIQRMNPAARALLPWGNETAGKSVGERTAGTTICDEDGHVLPVEDWAITRILRGEQIARGSLNETILKTPGLDDIYLSLSGAPLTDKQGTIIGGVMALRDVSAHHIHIHRIRQILNGLLITIQEASPKTQAESDFASVDWLRKVANLARTILGGNRVMLTSIAPEDARLHCLYTSEAPSEPSSDWPAHLSLDALFPAPLVEKLRSFEATTYEANQLAAGQSYITLGLDHSLALPLSMNGQLSGLILLGYDVATVAQPIDEQSVANAVSHLLSFVIERRQFQFQLDQLLATIQQQNADLHAQNEQVREATRAKSEFLSNMSHELRTPLTAITGFAEMLIDELIGPVEPDQRECLSDILTSARHLLQLINGILDLAKVEAGKMDFIPEVTRLAALISEVNTIIRPLLEKKHLQYEIEADPSIDEVYLDPFKFKQVLYNLLSNAIKFTPEDGQIHLRVAREDPAQLRITVTDSGIGIRPEDLPRLFGEFQQLDPSMQKKYQGTGLGLALTKHLIQAQGGDIGVQSVFGQGSTFWFTLPLTTPPHDEVLQGSLSTILSPATAPGSRLLVIEDDLDDQTFLLQSLIAAGYVVDIATTGSQALTMCRAQPYDAILLDLILPDMHGSEVARVLRNDPATMHIPILVVTVTPDKSLRIGGVVQEILAKPAQVHDLTQALERVGISTPHQSKILIIDDDATQRKLLEMLLKQQGYETASVADGLNGLATMGHLRPSAIILDLLMPTMNGWEVLAHIREVPEWDHIPIIIWTSLDLSAEARRQLAERAQVVLTKNDEHISLLLATVQQSVDAAGQEDKAA